MTLLEKLTEHYLLHTFKSSLVGEVVMPKSNE